MIRCRPALGTFVEISGPDEVSIEAGFAVIDTAQELMSAHDAESDIGRINRFAFTRPVQINRQTEALINRALHWSTISEGAFDIVRAGNAAIASGEIPSFSRQDDIDPNANWHDLTSCDGYVSLRRSCMIDVGGIAKGYAVDQAVKAMQGAQAKWGLVNAGGDLKGFGDKDWNVSVLHPVSRIACVEIQLRNRAIATSAGRILGFDSLNFRHLPDRGSDWISLTVEAQDAVDADAMTKIILANSKTAALCMRSTKARALGLKPDGTVEEIRFIAAA